MGFDNVEFADDSVLIYQPRFTDQTKSRVIAIAKLPNGKLVEVEKDVADKTSSFVRDIFLQYSEEEILGFTAREAAVGEKKRATDERVAGRKQVEAQRAATFQAKVDALEMPEVKNFPDKNVIRRLRKASSPFEVSTLVLYILDKTLGAGAAAPNAEEA